MVDVLMAGIAVPKRCDVQVRCDFLHHNSPEYATGTPIGAIVVGRFKRRGITTENSIEETTGIPGLGNCLTDRKSFGVFL